MAARDDNPGGSWRFLTAALARVDRQCRRHVVSAQGFDSQTAVVLLTAAVALTLQEYLFRSAELGRVESWLVQNGWFEWYAAGLEAVGGSPGGRLAGLLLWAVGTLLTYVVLPVLVIKLVLRRRVRDFGLSWRGILASSWVYPVMYLLMVGPLWYVSAAPRFLHTYPFYKPLTGEPLWPAFATWELFYWAQFVGLEFFFRGFLLHGTRHRFGIYAIFVMMVPYCMIHFGKPLPETLAAIVAGIALGFMSLKTRSIWLGAALHIAVAATMDGLALWRMGYFG